MQAGKPFSLTNNLWVIDDFFSRRNVLKKAQSSIFIVQVRCVAEWVGIVYKAITDPRTYGILMYIMVYLPTVHEMVDVYADVYVSVFFVVNLVCKHTSQPHGSSGTDSLIWKLSKPKVQVFKKGYQTTGPLTALNVV